MQSAEVVLGVLRERGRQGLPCEQLYRQMFNKDLYLLAYGNIYSNSGAMTPGASEETADGMSEEKIKQIVEAMRCERYRFAPARRSPGGRLCTPGHRPPRRTAGPASPAPGTSTRPPGAPGPASTADRAPECQYRLPCSSP